MKQKDQILYKFIKTYDADNKLMNYYIDLIFKNIPDAKKEILNINIKRYNSPDVTPSEIDDINEMFQSLYATILDMQTTFIAKDLGLDNIIAGVNRDGSAYITVNKETLNYRNSL